MRPTQEVRCNYHLLQVRQDRHAHLLSVVTAATLGYRRRLLGMWITHPLDSFSENLDDCQQLTAASKKDCSR
jgi:hypothetical protein